MPPIGKALIAEGIGAFALSFVGVMAISAADLAGATGIANLASIGLAHGLTIGVMIAALGAISGGHFNPAVTFGFVVTGRTMCCETHARYGWRLASAGLIASLRSSRCPTVSTATT